MIHGIGRKPDEKALRDLWRRAVAMGPNGIDLGAAGATSSMVYWADVLYPAPDPDVAAYENASEFESLAHDVGVVGAPVTLEQAVDPDWIARLGGKLLLQEAMVAGLDEPAPEGALGPEERIPLPWALKQKFLAMFLRDVHHYLFNVDFEPRPGERYKVRDEIRGRFVSELVRVAKTGEPQVVISHSMGTIIAYDCLKNVPGCPAIEALLTLGSPLGIDEIQDKLKTSHPLVPAPGWTRENGFPSDTLRGPWINVFDRLDVVAALDPKLANDFRKAGSQSSTTSTNPTTALGVTPYASISKAAACGQNCGGCSLCDEAGGDR
jgi:hypothetical protein